MERQVQDGTDTTSALRHCPHARIVRIGIFEATRCELSGPVPITWARWLLQVTPRALLGIDSSCSVRRRVESAESVLRFRFSTG